MEDDFLLMEGQAEYMRIPLPVALPPILNQSSIYELRAAQSNQEE